MKHPMAKMSNCQEEESKGYDSQEFDTEIILLIVIYNFVLRDGNKI